ncbi:MAG: hypothetical protein N3B17_07080 [Chlorobi bacterium]|nr:hypothetical protein [Chlorobiota bacterium]
MSIKQELSEATLDRIRTICRSHNAELIDYSLRGRQRSLVLELFIDSPDSVTHELCEQISRQIEVVLDTDPTLEGLSRLDVSSPGVERPLLYPWQYPKHCGRSFVVRTNDGTENRGILRDVRSDAIVLDSEEGLIEIPFTAIASSRVELEW